MKKSIVECYNEDNSAVDVICRLEFNEDFDPCSEFSERYSFDEVKDMGVECFDEAVECAFNYSDGSPVTDIALIEHAKEVLWVDEILPKFD